MKLVTLNSKPYGVFKTVEDTPDYLILDGIMFTKGSIGPYSVADVSDDYVLPTPPEEPVELSEDQIERNKKFNEGQRKKRAEAFATEADPLFFASERGEEEKAAWLVKVEEIRERFPYKPTGEGN